MDCAVYPADTLKEYKYVVILSLFRGRLLLSRHRQRDTWETQGGHIEAGETPVMAAARELMEESGAEEFTLLPLCDYLAGEGASRVGGMVFVADIEALGPLPASEMAETALFDALPENLTYPGITPFLYRYWQENGASKNVLPLSDKARR